jgi:hypothetical protein
MEVWIITVVLVLGGQGMDKAFIETDPRRFGSEEACVVERDKTEQHALKKLQDEGKVHFGLSVACRGTRIAVI